VRDDPSPSNDRTRSCRPIPLNDRSINLHGRGPFGVPSTGAMRASAKTSSGVGPCVKDGSSTGGRRCGRARLCRAGILGAAGSVRLPTEQLAPSPRRMDQAPSATSRAIRGDCSIPVAGSGRTVKTRLSSPSRSPTAVSVGNRVRRRLLVGRLYREALALEIKRFAEIVNLYAKGPWLHHWIALPSDEAKVLCIQGER